MEAGESFGSSSASASEQTSGLEFRRRVDAGLEAGSSLESLAGPAGGQNSGVQQAVGSVKRPHGDRHRERGGERQSDVVGRSQEPGPERGHRRCVQREQMPEAQRAGGDPGGGAHTARLR
jgi:hypothetical protein